MMKDSDTTALCNELEKFEKQLQKFSYQNLDAASALQLLKRFKLFKEELSGAGTDVFNFETTIPKQPKAKTLRKVNTIAKELLRNITAFKKTGLDTQQQGLLDMLELSTLIAFQLTMRENM